MFQDQITEDSTDLKALVTVVLSPFPGIVELEYVDSERSLTEVFESVAVDSKLELESFELVKRVLTGSTYSEEVLAGMLVVLTLLLWEVENVVLLLEEVDVATLLLEDVDVVILLLEDVDVVTLLLEDVDVVILLLEEVDVVTLLLEDVDVVILLLEEVGVVILLVVLIVDLVLVGFGPA